MKLYEPRQEKTVLLGFPTRSDTNRSVQSTERVRIMKFWLLVEEDCTIRVAKTKAPIRLAVTAQLICAFFFFGIGKNPVFS